MKVHTTRPIPVQRFVEETWAVPITVRTASSSQPSEAAPERLAGRFRRCWKTALGPARRRWTLRLQGGAR